MSCGGHSVFGFLREELLQYFSLSLVGWLLHGKANAPVWREMIVVITTRCTGAFDLCVGKGGLIDE